MFRWDAGFRQVLSMPTAVGVVALEEASVLMTALAAVAGHFSRRQVVV